MMTRDVFVLGSGSIGRRRILQRMLSSSQLFSPKAEGVVEGNEGGHDEESAVNAVNGKDAELLVVSPDIDEKAVRAELPEDLCCAVAEAKMKEMLRLATRIEPSTLSTVAAGSSERLRAIETLQRLYGEAKAGSVRLWIFTSDQVAVKDGAVREKPQDEDENRAFLASYRGSHVDTVATYCLRCVHGNRCASFLATSWTRTTFSSDLDDAAIDETIANGVTMTCAGGFAVEDATLTKFVTSCSPSVEAVQGIDEPTVQHMVRSLQVALSP